MNILLIISLIIAGPLIGSLIGIMKKPTARLLASYLGFATGIMFYISGDELIPCAERQKHTHSANIGMALGVITVLLTTLI